MLYPENKTSMEESVNAILKAQTNGTSVRSIINSLPGTTLMQWGTAGGKINVPSVKNPDLSTVVPWKPGVGQNIAMHTSPTASNLYIDNVWYLFGPFNFVSSNFSR